MPKGKMSLESLARFVQDGFTSMQEQMAQGFDIVSTEMTAIRRQLHTVVYHHELDVLERRVGILERKVKANPTR